MRAVWVCGAASSTHPRCFVPSWRTSTIEMMGVIWGEQNLRCVLVEKRKASVFVGSKNGSLHFLSSIPSSNSNCVNKQMQPWQIQPFSGASFSRNQHTNHGLLQLPPLQNIQNHLVFFVSTKLVWTEGLSRKTLRLLPNVQELKENLTDPNAPFGVDLLQLDMNFWGIPRF